MSRHQHRRADAQAWWEAYRAKEAEHARRHALALTSYEQLAGPGSWEQHEMSVTVWKFGGNCLGGQCVWDHMTEADIKEWAAEHARMDLELDEEIARERAEWGEDE